MEIRELATQVIFGDCLEEKLQSAGELTDETPGSAIVVPDFPKRPANLRVKSSNESVPIPRENELDKDESKARLLHFFANHELLAAELMALVLLKFPDAPKAFRRGVAKTLQEEQEHTRLYMGRMKALGCELGAYPVTGFFWNVLKDMGDPQDYVTGLPLTFEQANLDFAQYFERVFRQVEDSESAALMERIYKDEIRHVAYGLKWFRRWKPEGKSDWEAYCERLELPLSPRRAKGMVFNFEGRKQCGLDADFVEQLSVYSRSRGRCPDVYYFNPYAEWELGVGKGFTPAKLQRELQQDFETLPQFFGSDDDIVLVSRTPRTEWLRSIQSSGLVVPEFEVMEGERIAASSDLRERKIRSLRPWAWSPSSRALLEPLSARINSPDNAEKSGGLFPKSEAAELLSEIIKDQDHSDWLCGRDDVGRKVESAAAAFATIEEFRRRGLGRLVAKADFGAAGGRMARLWEETLTSHQEKWIEGAFVRGECLVIEPWRDRVCDFSIHFEMERGGARSVGLVSLLNDHRGQFQGCVIGSSPTFGMEVPVLKLLHGEQGDRYKRLIENIGEALSARCVRSRYEGPVGVDCFVYRLPDGTLRLKPLVEVNRRYSMGRLAIGLKRFVQAGRILVFGTLGRKSLETIGLGGFQELPGWLHGHFPLERSESKGRKIVSGGICLTDPEMAHQHVGLLLVGREAHEWYLEHRSP